MRTDVAPRHHHHLSARFARATLPGAVAAARARRLPDESGRTRTIRIQYSVGAGVIGVASLARLVVAVFTTRRVRPPQTGGTCCRGCATRATTQRRRTGVFAFIASLAVLGTITLCRAGDAPLGQHVVDDRARSRSPRLVLAARQVMVAAEARLVVAVWQVFILARRVRILNASQTGCTDRCWCGWKRGIDTLRTRVACVVADARGRRQLSPDETTVQTALIGQRTRSTGINDATGTRMVDRTALARLVVAVGPTLARCRKSGDATGSS